MGIRISFLVPFFKGDIMKKIKMILVFAFSLITLMGISSVYATTNFSVPRKAMKIYDKLDLNDIITTDSASYTFTSSDSSIVSVDNDGVAVANKLGQAIITVSDSNSSDTLIISSGYYVGIDVSVWNGDVDWPRVKAQGIDFAMIRSSFGWYDDDDLAAGKAYDFQYDAKLQRNVKGAIDNDIQFGIYHFSYAKTVEEANMEADYLLSAIDSLGDNYKSKISLPVTYDVEFVKSLSKTELTDIVIAFCTKIAQAGYQPMVYANTDFFVNRLELTRLNAMLYNYWYAWPTSSPNYNSKMAIRGTDIVPLMWQYSWNGDIAGAQTSAGELDMDILYMKDRVKVELYDNGNLIDFVGVNKGETLDKDLPVVEKEGYVFDGYFDASNNIVDTSTIFNDNTRLNAKYTKIKINELVAQKSVIDVDKYHDQYIKFSLVPPDASLVNETIIYNVADSSILSVDSKTGKIIPKKDGQTIVTCILSSDRSVQATVTIKVHLNYVKGDLDRNNLVDANDASIALEIFKNESQTTDDLKYGDMDENGIIDANDASLILELYKTNM